MRLALRILILSTAVAVIAAAVYLVVASFPVISSETLRHGFRRGPLFRRHRFQPGAVIEYIGKFILLGAIALIGRRVFKLHL